MDTGEEIIKSIEQINRMDAEPDRIYLGRDELRDLMESYGLNYFSPPGEREHFCGVPIFEVYADSHLDVTMKLKD